MSILLLVLLLLWIAINGFFVAAEFAVVRSRRARLEQMRDEGVRGAGRALDQLDRVDQVAVGAEQARRHAAENVPREAARLWRARFARDGECVVTVGCGGEGF